ncbi:MAG: diaminopimelate decarboxylase [Nitrososphaerota archaeon]|jgi:diaminopimelate decarboxylase|uniref:diaminopimelate decarboxylase n=1 Tax=Candidatus Bathycorpusculum sp. TaxID=2994959 RepID=UPI00281EE9FE|nr:diaminopimelate decarboxylase [Candidatus Termitimicrobium sp.]MCL2431095.1 diaminopimelate decarboxylase [Candidatus Termitimicrobium sp.]MDR0492023.1 diaminopimelate decarboxylase [Nitrososphaerota archaeon]
MVKRKLHEPLEDHKGNLYFEGISTVELAKTYDTPLFVISEKRIQDNYNRLYGALVNNYKYVRIYYAAKANTNLNVLRILQSQGAYLDTVSPGEVFLALSSGFTPDRILFTGTSVRNDELKMLADANITINVDSQSEMDRLLKISVPQILSVRVNPEVVAGHHNHCITAGPESKFGLWEEEVIQAYAIAQRARVERFGIHMHIGSGILDLEPYVQAVEKLLSIAKRVHKEVGIDFEFIDIGGGFGVPYKPKDKELDLQEFSNKVVNLFKNKIKEYGLGKPFLFVEPGRYLVADASILLTTVNTVKVTPSRRFVGVDAGFNTLIRPTMYDSYHPILVANKLTATDKEIYDVAGPICESGDLLAKNRPLPEIMEGDLLAVLNAGAYGYSMSNQYNSRPRAAEVLIRGGKPVVVREREQLKDLLTNQKVQGEA